MFTMVHQLYFLFLSYYFVILKISLPIATSQIYCNKFLSITTYKKNGFLAELYIITSKNMYYWKTRNLNIYLSIYHIIPIIHRISLGLSPLMQFLVHMLLLFIFKSSIHIHYIYFTRPLQYILIHVHRHLYYATWFCGACYEELRCFYF